MNLHSIYANTIADNHASVHLLERIGFRREGTRREFSWEEDGTFHDSAMYGLLTARVYITDEGVATVHAAGGSASPDRIHE